MATPIPPEFQDELHESGDRLVTAERSMFGTRLPRPTGVGRHLVVVLVIFVVALGLAIAFAESRGGDGTPGPSPTPTSP
ncbi:MAG: hypothetical protein HYS27_21025 [Deltaproteobacteria bacterium]|nr:hypothetical protein [Deltaproteobacteria bacterium]